ncbi:MAG: hypothetical protein JXB00_14450 [Bacteroidales bacterium]|nr:hypothetical protein [Bacteroidales bacterium]
MYRYKKNAAIALFLSLISICGYSQTNICGTELTDKQRDYELGFTDSVNTLIRLDRKLAVSLYFVKNEEGETGVDLTALSTAFTALNNAFEQIGLSFDLSSPQIIDNYHFDEVQKGGNETELTAQFQTSHSINLYLVSELYDAASQPVCAYTYYPSENKDVIFLVKTCISASILIEQFGHFFNLYHTHETGFAKELVNGSNCATAGDLCCDTPADPNLTGKVSFDCQYSSTEKDSNDDYYLPTVYNYMSFAPDACNKCFFSSDQYLRMINCILKSKSHLW